MGYRDRVTVCVSSQAGCAMGVGFCATGQMGLESNLTEGEIAAQVVWARREAARRWQRLARRRRSISTLVDFHTRHKFLLLAHSERHYRKLGRIVAEVKHFPSPTPMKNTVIFSWKGSPFMPR